VTFISTRLGGGCARTQGVRASISLFGLPLGKVAQGRRAERKPTTKLKMKVKIKSVKAKPFTGEDGEKREYFWYRAEAVGGDGFAFQFGSIDGDHEKGKEYDLDIEKYTRADGKDGFKEFVEVDE